MSAPVLLADHIRPHHLVLYDGTVVPGSQVSQDDDQVMANLLCELRAGVLIASARLGPYGNRRDLPADFWESVSACDVGWQLSAVPAYGLVAVTIRPAEAVTKRGRKPEAMARTCDSMRRDLETRGAEYLRSMKEEEMAARYKVGRDTARRARQAILEAPPA